MKIPAPVSNAYNYASTGVANAKKHASDGLDSTKKAVETKYAQFSETKAGKHVSSFLNFVKKVSNVPIQFVRNHPKATIAVGMITTVIGGITANAPAIGIGITLLAAGALAQSANRHAQMKEAMANMQQGGNRQSGISQADLPQYEDSVAEIAQPAGSLSELPQSEVRQPSFLQPKLPQSEVASGSYSFLTAK